MDPLIFLATFGIGSGFGREGMHEDEPPPSLMSMGKTLGVNIRVRHSESMPSGKKTQQPGIIRQCASSSVVVILQLLQKRARFVSVDPKYIERKNREAEIQAKKRLLDKKFGSSKRLYSETTTCWYCPKMPINNDSSWL